METPRPAPRFFAALLLGASIGCGASEPDVSRRGSLSLLAVGDTGQPVTALAALDPGHAVAAAMAEEDARAPVDAVVLLGDNFYPDGLEEDELKDRLRENLVGPFCRFVALTSRGAGSLREACPEARALHPIPIFAVLGNHDYGERESPDLQRKRVPDYVSSWRMPPGDVEVQELEGGVSLVLIDSNRVGRDDDDREVVRALRRSRGPWRVIAAHHPMPDVGRGYDARFERRMGELIEAAGAPIHVYLAGHEHNLQALVGEGPGPALHLVAGGGSDVRELGDGDPRRSFGSASLGFARIDVHDGPQPRLVASLLEVPAPPLPGRARPAARFEVLEDGQVRALAPEADGP